MSMHASPAQLQVVDEARAWPFEEARRIVDRLKKVKGGMEKTVLFETGYGPSGLPHIGTFGEVARTSMVRRAFEALTEGKVKTRLLCFSDDMDGMRKVPDNVPNQEMLRENLHRPLTRVPDPFGQYESFGHHNNAMLRRFLDTFGFEYEFASATDYYTSGKFDEILLLAAERYQKIMDIMLPSLGEERQATYSCFLPISPKTGRVLYVPMKDVNAKAGTITYTDEDGDDVTLPVTGGNVKLQWKPDFGARWAALGVDFEMYGKDHMSNTVIYDGICKVLGGAPPEHFVYELFLDEKGEKISKSKGNGLTIDEWLTYATPESLALFMFQKPKSAKKLHFDVIPRAVDDYLQFLGAYPQPGTKSTTRQPRLAHPRRHPPPAIKPDLVCPSAQSRCRFERREQGRAVGLHPPPHGGCDAAEISASRYARRLCRSLLPRLRVGQEVLSRSGRCRTCRSHCVVRSTGSRTGTCDCRAIAGHRLRHRPVSASIPGLEGKRCDSRTARRFECMVCGDL